MRWASSALAAKIANSLLGCISRKRASILRKGIIPLCSALLRLQLKLCSQFWFPQPKTNIDKLEEVQCRTTVVTGGWSTHPVRRHWGKKAGPAWSRDGLRQEKQLPLASGRRYQGRVKLFTNVYSGRMRRNRHWLNQERFWLLVRKSLYK